MKPKRERRSDGWCEESKTQPEKKRKGKPPKMVTPTKMCRQGTNITLLPRLRLYFSERNEALSTICGERRISVEDPTIDANQAISRLFCLILEALKVLPSSKSDLTLRSFCKAEASEVFAPRAVKGETFVINEWLLNKRRFFFSLLCSFSHLVMKMLFFEEGESERMPEQLPTCPLLFQLQSTIFNTLTTSLLAHPSLGNTFFTKPL